MHFEEHFYIDLLRQQICFNCEKIGDVKTGFTVHTIDVTSNCKNTKDIPRLLGSQENIVACSTIDARSTTPEAKRQADLVQEVKPQSQSKPIKAPFSSLDVSKYQLNVDIEDQKSQNEKLKTIPLFRGYIPSRVIMSARKLISDDSGISVDEALRKASALHGLNLQHINVARVTKLKRRLSLQRQSDIIGKRRLSSSKIETAEMRIDRANGHLNRVLPRRPSWYHTGIRYGQLEESTNGSKSSVTYLHPKKLPKGISN